MDCLADGYMYLRNVAIEKINCKGQCFISLIYGFGHFAEVNEKGVCCN